MKTQNQQSIAISRSSNLPRHSERASGSVGYCHTEHKRRISKTGLGTFGTAAEMQKYIDQESLRKACDAFIENFYDSQDEKINSIILKKDGYADWDVVQGITNYSLEQLGYYYFDELSKDEVSQLYKGKMPSYQDTRDFYINQSLKLSDKDKMEFDKAISNYKSSNKDMPSVQAQSNYIAFIVHTLDRIAFKNFMEKEHIDKYSAIYDNSKYEKFLKYFENVFIQTAKP